MKKALSYIAFIFALSLPLTVMAQDKSRKNFNVLDTNKDGQVSFEEAKVAHPNWTDVAFSNYDEDGNGMLSPTEYTKARGSG